MSSGAAGGAGSSTCMRAILQQCTAARLQVAPATEHTPAQFVEIRRGLVIYICFLQGATEEKVDKIVKTALNCRLSRNTSDGKLVSILDLPGDLLIVPQATLGGKPKGKSMQYHENINKDVGRELYTYFVDNCKRTFENCKLTKERDCFVKWGTYGNLQVLNIDTNGPYSHIIDL